MAATERIDEKKKVGKATGNDLDVSKYTKLSLEETREKMGDRLASRFKTSPTQLTPEYAAKLNGERKSNQDLIAKIAKNVSRQKRRITPSQISFEEGRKIIWEAYKIVLSEQGREFISESGANENKEVIPKLLKYFLGIESDLDLKKGILLVGGTGSGKTLLLRLFKSFTDEIDYEPRKFSTVDIADIDNEISIEGGLSPIKKYMKGAYFLDDIGVENESKIYGSVPELIPRLMLSRYSLFQRDGTLTHATSNLRLPDFKDRYGRRVFSRMTEMFNEVILKGIDKRINHG